MSEMGELVTGQESELRGAGGLAILVILLLSFCIWVLWSSTLRLTRSCRPRGIDLEVGPGPSSSATEEDECPVCLEYKSGSMVYTSCRHVFCEPCILHHWNVERRRSPENDLASCPLCRAQIITIYPLSSPTVSRAVAEYNSHSLGRGRGSRGCSSFYRAVCEGPLLLRSFLALARTSPRTAFSFLYLIGRSLRFVLIFIGTMAYSILPADILPERTLGWLGWLDDWLVVLMFVVFFLSLFKRHVLAVAT